MTLDQFIAEKKYPKNAYVKEPGFKSLYVRHAKHAINNEVIETLDIANIEVKPKQRRKGVFTNLIRRLHKEHNLYVECVMNPDLERLLLKEGFVLADQGEERLHPFKGAASYFLGKQESKCGMPS